MGKRAIIVLLFSLITTLTATNTFAQYGRTITFGTLYFYPPFVYSNAAGPYGGFDVDFGRELCKKMAVDCRFLAFPLTDLFKNLNNNTVDAVISAINISGDRKINFDFTVPYLRSSASYLINAKNSTTLNVQNLKNKKIGVPEGSVFYLYLVQLYGNTITIKTYPEVSDMVYALTTNDIDLALLDTPVAHYWQKNSTGTLALLGIPINSEQFFGQGYGIVLNHGNATLLNALNNSILASQADGTFQALLNKYFETSSFTNS